MLFPFLEKPPAFYYVEYSNQGWQIVLGSLAVKRGEMGIYNLWRNFANFWFLTQQRRQLLKKLSNSVELPIE